MLSLGDDGLAGGNIAPCDAQRARVGRAAARMRDIERCVAARAGGAAEAMQIWEERRALWSARMLPPTRGCRNNLTTLLDANAGGGGRVQRPPPPRPRARRVS